jgi:hypothetical protein
MVREAVKLSVKPEKVAAPRSVGRPSKFTQEIADYICEQIINGRDLTEICENDEGIPSRATVYRWTCERPEFATQCARAREACADFEMYKMKKLADDCTEENVNSTRAKLNHMQWRVMKMAPRVYGDKTTTEITGAGGGAIHVTKTTIDVRLLDADSRDAFKQALLAAKTIEHDPNEGH